jgi:hypothetical protein
MPQQHHLAPLAQILLPSTLSIAGSHCTLTLSSAANAGNGCPAAHACRALGVEGAHIAMPMSRSLVLSSLSLIAVLSATLPGCGTNRPLNIVRKDADNAYIRGNFASAEGDYQQYLSRRPEENAIRVKLAETQLAQGNTRDAINNLYIALDVEPTNDRIIDLYAEALYQGKERDALTAFVYRAANERQRVVDYIRVAKYMQLIGHPDEARQALLTAARLDDGKSFDVQMAVADFYKRVGDKRNHIRRLRMAYFLNPENEDLIKEIRAAGDIPGPTFAMAPEEFSVPVIASEPESR